VKKIGTVGLILVFCQLVLVGPLFLLQQMRWKEHMMTEIKQNISDFQAEELYFSDAQFDALNWHEGKREFSISGKFYDVIEIKTVYGGKVIKCVNDKEEELLVKRYIDSGKGQSNPLHHMVKSLVHSLLYEPVDHRLNAVYCTVRNLELHGFLYFFSLKESSANITYPPPNFS
jgi:hypothetical protein